MATGDIGPFGASLVALFAAGYVLLEQPLTGNMNLLLAGFFAVFGIGIIAGQF